MDYLQYDKINEELSGEPSPVVLNLVINGLPSIQRLSIRLK